jgi:hypothetical protein
MEEAKPQDKMIGKRWRYMFLTSGSVWFGTLAIALEVVWLSGFVLGWWYVERGATGSEYPGSKAVIAERFGVRAPRIEVAINDQRGTHWIKSDTLIVSTAWSLIALGLILAFVTCFAAPCKGRLLPFAFLTNLFALLFPFLIRLFFPPE